MEPSISILHLQKHFFCYKDKHDRKYRNKITNYSHYSANEATICNKIKQIPYYSNFCSILERYETLNISQLDDNIIERISTVEGMQYYVFTYNDYNASTFIDLMYTFTNSKKLILDNINALEHMLCGLCLLNDNNICFFDISPKNILFLEHYREKPVFSNFKCSLLLHKLDYEYLSRILNKINDFTYQPFEIHLLYYFVKHEMTTVSYAFMEEFCEEFIENLHILRLFSDRYKKIYREQCIETLRKYVNRSRKEIVDDILERNEKWDVYGISMLFLHIFGCISRTFSLKGTFINKITMELSKNLHPNSDKRMSLEETLDTFHRCLNEQHDWMFVNKLDNNKLPTLFDEFSK